MFTLPLSKDTIGIGTYNTGADICPLLMKRWHSDKGKGLREIIKDEHFLGLFKKSNDADYYIPTSNVSIFIENRKNHIFFDVKFTSNKLTWGFNGETNSNKSFPLLAELISENKEFFILLESPSHEFLIRGIHNGVVGALDVGFDQTHFFKLEHSIIIR